MVTQRNNTVGTPRWVKVQGVFVLLLILVVVAMSTGLVDGHGGHDYSAPSSEPAPHAPSGDTQHMGGHR